MGAKGKNLENKAWWLQVGENGRVKFFIFFNGSAEEVFVGVDER